MFFVSAGETAAHIFRGARKNIERTKGLGINDVEFANVGFERVGQFPKLGIP